MTDQELLLAISDIMDKKIKSELQPVRDDLKMMNENIQQRIDALEQRLDSRIDALEQRLDSRIDALEQRLDSRIDSMEVRAKSIELHLENVTDKNIKLLAENYLPAAKRYERATAAIDAMQVDIDLMKGVIRNHSEQLQQIS